MTRPQDARSSDAVHRAKAGLPGADDIERRTYMDLLRTAAADGDAEAAALLATLSAAGAWTPQDWAAALAYLEQAAELGSKSAQGQLLLLSEGFGADWPSRREAIDLDRWLQLTPRMILCEKPRVRMSEGFITQAAADWLIGLARGRTRPAMMVEGPGAVPHFTTDRTNSDFIFDIFNADVVLTLVRTKISRMLQLPVEAMEPPQIFHYAVGQELKPHVDYLRRDDRRAGDPAYSGDRIATVLIYLNDDFEGGETWFPRADLKAKAKKGGALYFANVDPAGAPDPNSLHAGTAPTTGEKWLFSQWIHDRPFGR
jgi:hypothetical protein